MQFLSSGPRRGRGNEVHFAIRDRVRSTPLPFALAAMLTLGFAPTLRAAPILHEFIERAGATPTLEGDLPAQPGVGGPGTVPEAAEGQSGSSPGSPRIASQDGFSIDSDTSEPETVPYADPFTPRVTPFKRARAFDSVNSEGTLRVARPKGIAVARGLPQRGDESFHASFSLQLSAGRAQPIPTPGPGARIVHLRSEPPAALELRRDSADNWSVHAPVSVDTELTLQLSVSRHAFGGRLALPSWEELALYKPRVPAAVRRQAERVARALGISAKQTPTEVVSRLTEHFRAFVPAEEGASGMGLALYAELALGGRGVCRHRAYAFTVTALGIGIPVRYVDNEAHAWVEIFTGTFWQRLDLGGAARQLDAPQDERPEHVPPADPLPWPAGAQPGRSLVRQRSAKPSSSPSTGVPDALPEHTSVGGASGSFPTSDAREPPATASSEPPRFRPARGDGEADARRLRVALQLKGATAVRGESVFFEGTVQNNGVACARVSVDLWLADEAGQKHLLGRLSGDEQGRFSGPLVVPPWAATGDHEVWGAVSPGQTCAARR